MIYETSTRPREVLEARIELWNRNTDEITFPKTKGKYNRWTRRHIPGAPKIMKLTGSISVARGCGIMWGEGAYFHQREDGEEIDPAAF